MRKWLALLLCLCLLPLPVKAQDAPRVALTFDDGPSGRFTRRLLEGLEERQVKATFFLCGYRMRENPALTEEIFLSGHEIGLHGDSHQCMARMSLAQLRKELDATRAALPAGCDPVLFRPPGGSTGKNVTQAAREQGLSLLLWSVDPRDWAVHDAPAVEAAVVGAVRDGDVILLHDMCDCSVDAALSIIDQLQSKGFRFCTVSELAQHKGTALTPGERYCRFP